MDNHGFKTMVDSFCRDHKVRVGPYGVRVFSLEQTRKMMRMGRQTVTRAIKDGRLKADVTESYVTGRKTTLINEADLLAFWSELQSGF